MPSPQSIRAFFHASIKAAQSHSKIYHVENLRGVQQISRHQLELAKLSGDLYAEWPYYTQPNLNDDLAHVAKIMNHPEGLVCAAFHNGRLIGAVMGRPQVNVSCVNAAYPDQTDTFHLSDCLVHPDFRGQNIAHDLYLAFEEQIRATGSFCKISCTTLITAPSPKPQNAVPMDLLLEKNHYVPVIPAKPMPFEWTLLGHNEDSEHPMRLWVKTLEE